MKKILILLSVISIQLIAFTQNKISSYQYWIDNDFGNQTNVAITPEINFHLQTDLNLAGTEKGLHTFNIRFKDENLKYSSVLSQLFYAKAISNSIIAYEYWFDSDYMNKVNVSLTPQENFNLISNFDCSTLANGLHTLHIRFQDDGDKWSAVVSQFFQKSGNGSSAINQITAYRYWLDSAYTEITTVSLAIAQNQYHLMQDFDFTNVPKGEHLFNIQFKDTAGYWSSVLTDTVIKNALPIANFNYTSIANCDSTVVDLSNLSVDGDTYAWDFGDGNSSTDSLPLLTYYSPGSYIISLTVTDLNSGLDSTLTKTIIVQGPSSNTFAMEECFQAISPSGLYIWTQSGQYLDTIPNHFACDSLLTVNVTINNVDASASNTDNILSASLANANYQWIDCENGNQAINGATNQTFTPSSNGSYAVIVNNTSCSDTSTCLVVDNLNVNELVDFYGINVFPNPTKGVLNISISKQNTAYQIRIKDITGRILLADLSPTSTTNSFDLTNFSNGIYVVEIGINRETTQIKFVKN